MSIAGACFTSGCISGTGSCTAGACDPLGRFLVASLSSDMPGSCIACVCFTSPCTCVVYLSGLVGVGFGCWFGCVVCSVGVWRVVCLCVRGVVCEKARPIE